MMTELLGKTDIELGAHTPDPLWAKSGISSLSAPAFSIAPGEILQERYRVLSMVARGGMGTVYHVEHVLLRKELALKVLNPNLSQAAWRRFETEAKATSRLDHPALLAVHDFGLLSNAVPFFVMDYFQGQTLSQLIKKNGRLPLQKTLEIFIQVAFGLAHAHQQGVIHRDIKPSNIMLANFAADGPPVIKIVDFGIAKVVNSQDIEALTLTKTGEIFGTPFYMSPEQCLGGALDYRSDIYSLGCVLFETLTGTQPFVGGEALAIMMKHQTKKAPLLKEASMGTDFPDSIEQVVAKMMAKSPAARYQNLFEVAADLNRVKKGASIGWKGSPGHKKSRSERLTLNIVALTSVLLLVALTMMGVGLASWQPDRGIQSAARAHVDQFANAETEAASRAPIKYGDDSQPYSNWAQNQPGTRYFHFPALADDSLGVFFDVPAQVKMLKVKDGRLLPAQTDAYGDIIMENFQPFGLRASMCLTEDNELLRRFRNDEIGALDIAQNFELCDDVLQPVTAWTALQALSLRESKDLTDGCLKYIDQMPRLKALTISSTKITGLALARLNRLKSLTTLRVRSINDAARILPKLEGDAVLKELDLTRDGLSDNDLLAIAKIPNLQILNIGYNPNLSDRGIENLTHLSHLTDLRMQRLHLSFACITSLQKLPHLRRLTIDGYPNMERVRSDLRQALPNCTVDLGDKDD